MCVNLQMPQVNSTAILCYAKCTLVSSLFEFLSAHFLKFFKIKIHLLILLVAALSAFTAFAALLYENILTA